MAVRIRVNGAQCLIGWFCAWAKVNAAQVGCSKVVLDQMTGCRLGVMRPCGTGNGQ